jgi:hypothetical protein
VSIVFFSMASGVIRRELNHFLHQAPHLNNMTMDYGWNCRDHALLTALMVHSQGKRTALMHGKTVFVLGPRGNRAPFALRQDAHTWTAVEGYGLVDLSIKPAVSLAGHQVKFPFNCVVKNDSVPSGKGRLHVVRDESEFQRLVDEGLAKQGASLLIYLHDRGEELDQGHIIYADRWINSPLTDELRTRFNSPNEAYAALLLHLLNLSEGNARSLAIVDQWQAWERLMAGNGDRLLTALSRVQRRLPLLEPAT